MVSLLQQHRTFEHEWVEIWAIWISLSYRIAPEKYIDRCEGFVYSMLDLEYEKAGVISKRGIPSLALGFQRGRSTPLAHDFACKV